MFSSKYEEQRRVDEDLTEVVGTRDQLKQAALRYGVTAGVLHLQHGEDLVSDELLVPGCQEDESGQPGRPGH